jgi:hypothetical protein
MTKSAHQNMKFSLKNAFLLLTCTLLISFTLTIASKVVKLDDIKVSISGISSGGFQSVQLGTAYSRLISNVGVIAGGVYNAAQNNVATALTIMDYPEYISLPLIHSQMSTYLGLQYIDNPQFLSNQRNYIFCGTRDTTVNPRNSLILDQFYSKYHTETKVVNDIPSEHAFLTIKPTPHECGYKGSPFINNCNFDLLTDMFEYFFPKQQIQPPIDAITSNLHQLDQFLFIPPQYKAFLFTNGIQRRSYVYIPQGCEEDILSKSLFQVLKYSQQRVDESATPGPQQRAFEQLRERLWVNSTLYTYFNGTTVDSDTNVIYNQNDHNGNHHNDHHQIDPYESFEDLVKKQQQIPKNEQKCKVHIALHGCKQTLDHIGVEFLTSTGYLEIAESNNIIVLFPQASMTVLNPNGCWDWWGFSTPLYATRFGVQPMTILNQAITLAAMINEPR